MGDGAPGGSEQQRELELNADRPELFDTAATEEHGVSDTEPPADQLTRDERDDDSVSDVGAAHRAGPEEQALHELTDEEAKPATEQEEGLGEPDHSLPETD